MKKILIWVLVLVFVVSICGLSIGCKKATTETAGTTEAVTTSAETTTAAETTAATSGVDKKKIGRIFIFEGDSFQQACIKQAQTWCDEKGITLVRSSSDGDIEKQTSQLEDLISQKVGAIIIQPVNGPEVNPFIQRAHDAGIAFISWGVRHTEGTTPFLTVDVPNENYEMGKLMATDWKKKNPDDKLYLSLGTMREAAYFTDRVEVPFVNGVKEVYPDVTIYEVPFSFAWDAEKTTAGIEDQIQAHPEINMIFWLESVYAIWIQAALDAMGRGTPDSQLLAGQSGDYSEYSLIMDPTKAFKYTVGCLPRTGETRCFDVALQCINGELALDSDYEEMIGGKLMTGTTPREEWKKLLWDEWYIDLDEMEKAE